MMIHTLYNILHVRIYLLYIYVTYGITTAVARHDTRGKTKSRKDARQQTEQSQSRKSTHNRKLTQVQVSAHQLHHLPLTSISTRQTPPQTLACRCPEC